MDDVILITELNDFVFCPISIYFHKLYGDTDVTIYQSTYQINGTKAHESVDNKKYTNTDIIKAIDVYSEKYHLSGKIDIYNTKTKTLIERKKKVKNLYDGYIFQLFGQYYCMSEMGYEIKYLEIYSMDDNRKYSIELPEQNIAMKVRFETIIREIQQFDISSFEQTNILKCNNCIYEPACDRSIKLQQ